MYKYIFFSNVFLLKFTENILFDIFNFKYEIFKASIYTGFNLTIPLHIEK